MELLVSGVMQSANAALSPGEALRRVMEAIAGGILLEHGPGLRDPCEKELVVSSKICNDLHSLLFYTLHRSTDISSSSYNATGAIYGQTQTFKYILLVCDKKVSGLTPCVYL